MVAIYKIKTTLADNKLAYAGICTLELRKVPIYVEFHYDYIKKIMTTHRAYYSQKLTAWCLKLKLKMFLKILVGIQKCLILVIILLSQNITMIQTQWFVK